MTSQSRKTLSRRANQLVEDETGATAVEYGLMIAAIAAVIITIVFSVGFKMNSSFTFVDGEMAKITQP